jgi:hypothetical protein
VKAVVPVDTVVNPAAAAMLAVLAVASAVLVATVVLVVVLVVVGTYRAQSLFP